MKLLVFAHTPPPLHGQSAMVQMMMDGFGSDQGGSLVDSSACTAPEIQCYHVNCRVSNNFSEIGEIQITKFFLLLRYCMQAIFLRFAHGIDTFYYIPAPGKRAAFYRDWIVMSLCRPFFRKVIFHWHAAGLGDWVAKEGHWLERKIAAILYARPSLGIALARTGVRDSLWFFAKKLVIVPNGIVDACPDFSTRLLPLRQERLQRLRTQRTTATEQDPLVLQILYMAHCTREKGLFDTLEAVAIFNQRDPARQAHLKVAGSFPDAGEAEAFHTRIAQPDLAGAVEYIGFIEGDRKNAFLEQSDVLCFPTFYHAESFGLVLLEAMAMGLPSITTRWRAIPEVLPPDYPLFVGINAPCEIADAFGRLPGIDLAASLRAHFEKNYTIAQHLHNLKAAIQSV